MRLGNSEDVRKRNLVMLLSEACRKYIDEVLEHNKLYTRFKDDFINLHRYTDCKCAMGKNAHLVNLHIVEGILSTRQDLVERYFVNKSPSQAQLCSMVEEYDTTIEPIQTYKLLSNRIGDVVPPAFGCYFGKMEISLITQYAFEAFLFIGTVGEAEIEALFSCALKTPLRVSNNRKAAIFFDELSRKNLICREWQLVIDKNSLLVSSTGTKLTSNKLSSALSQSQGNDIKYRPKFAQMAKELQKISPTAKNENK